MSNPDDYLTRKEAAKYLRGQGVKVAPKTLANLAANNNAGKGPSYIITGWNSVLYHKADLDLWATKRKPRRVE